jgi:rubrerythrin
MSAKKGGEMGFGSIDEILDFAIGKEEEAARFYTGLAQRATNPGIREAFSEFAKEEEGHREKLLAVKEEKIAFAPSEKVTDLKIAETVQDVQPNPDMDYQDALILAMKEEKAAYKLYTDLAAMTDVGSLRATFLALAQEEAKHKLRFEIEYDDLTSREY